MSDRKRYTGGRRKVGGRQRYLGDREKQAPRDRYTGATKTEEPPEKHHRGFFGSLKHIAGQTAEDLKNAAIYSPAGIYRAGKILYAPPSKENTREFVALGKGMAQQTAEDIRHPLRHPGYTALDLLALGSAGVGAGGRVAAAGKTLKETGEVGRAARTLATRPQPAPRTLRLGEVEAQVPASRGALARQVQKTRDVRQMRKAEKQGPEGRAHQKLAGRIAKQLHYESEVSQKVERAQHAMLTHLDKKLSAPQKMAIRIVAEGRPVSDVLKFHRDRIAELEPKNTPAARLEIRRHERAHKLVQQAGERYVRTVDGKPAFRSGVRTKVGHLGDVYARAQSAQASTEKLLGRLGFSPEGLKARKAAPGRVVGGARYEAPTPGKLGVESEALKSARARVARLEERHHRSEALTGDVLPIHLGGRGASARTERLGGALSVAKDELQRLEQAAARREKPTGLVGAEGFTNPEGLYLPGARKPGALGRVTMGERGVIGVAKKPTALTREYTGASKLHALERPDVLRALGEHGIEVHRYASKLQALDALKPLGRTAPPAARGWRFIRTDTGTLGPETRALVDRIDRGEQLGPEEGMSLSERVKETGRNALNAGRALSADEQAALAREGKGLWVPESAVKPFERAFAPKIGGPAMTVVDEVNNAMKIATLYLKPAYAVPNLLGNIALNLVQQGFAAPGNLARAARLSAHVDKGTLLRVDELMGEGVAAALRGEGARPLGRAATFAAGKWSAVVDRVPRRASFLYEAKKAGYSTPRQLERLTTDESLRTQLAHVTQRANKEMIDYGGLSPVEQNVVRRIIYFYPWVRGATRYAGRIAAEHPVAAGAAGELGQQGEQFAQETLGDVPYYMEGAFGVGGNRLLNPAAAAILQTPAQVGEAAYGLASGHPNLPALTEFGSPVAELGLAAATGRSSLGIPLTGKGGPVAQSALQQVKSLPIPLMAQRIKQARAGEGKDRIFPPDERTAILLYLLGGAVTPRPYNPRALKRAYQRELRPR